MQTRLCLMERLLRRQINNQGDMIAGFFPVPRVRKDFVFFEGRFQGWGDPDMVETPAPV